MKQYDILEVFAGKGKPFTLLKDLINNKNEHLSDKFTPLVPNYTFALSDSKDNTGNEDEDDSPNVALLKFIESKGDVLNKGCEGTSKNVVFSEKIRGIKSTPAKEN